LEIPGGTFFRTYTNGGAGPTAEADPATVSGFRLDKYDVTVGRFRQFVSAWHDGAGYTPPAGSGKHTHLNGGQGLSAAGPAGYETGWDTTDNANVAPTGLNIDSCYTCGSVWTDLPGPYEDLPMGCVNWYEAYAFCIWDGGFLPSEAEWTYAEAGGSQQRAYPWGSADPGTASQYAITGCLYGPGGLCNAPASVAPVGSATLGAGLWGQLDLVGEVWQWALDLWGPYTACTDCVNLVPSACSFPPCVPGGLRVSRGGAFNGLSTSFRMSDAPAIRTGVRGFRCARTP
jgi:formylglycine-generating enzyme required for sulfatase activity